MLLLETSLEILLTSTKAMGVSMPSINMIRADNCLDNAVTERFFRPLKSERISYRDYMNRE